MERGSGPSISARTRAISYALASVAALACVACSLARTPLPKSCGAAGRSQTCADTCGAGVHLCQGSGEWGACVCIGGSTTAGIGGEQDAAFGSTAGTSSGTGGAGAPLDASNTLDGGNPGDSSASPLDSGPMERPLYAKCTGSADCVGQDRTCDMSISMAFGMGPGSGGVCTHTCTQNTDCPAPTTGNATLSCSNGLCQLQCSLASTCPGTLMCFSFGPAGVCY